MEIIKDGSVTSPAGFLASGIKAGLKRNGQPDMAMIFCTKPATVAAAFTSNLFAAAPVQLDRQIVAAGNPVRAVVVNSGNANACTGEEGMENARKMAAQAAELLKVQPNEVLVSSTGRIGVQMPMDIISNGIEMAVQALSEHGGIDAANGIITTDTVAKYLAVKLEIGGKEVRIGGMTKGAGMIAPQMRVCPPQATMLAYVTTDAVISQSALHACLSQSLDQSFNRIIVDGDTSTNDTFIAMASNLAGNPTIQQDTKDFEAFCNAFRFVTETLAKEMVLDGEGVSKFVELNISGTASDAEARQIAEAIARSPLCKTAWFGNDPNWGRILDAAGYSGVQFDPNQVSLDFGDLPIVRNGMDAGIPEAEKAQAVSSRNLFIHLNVGSGNGKFTIWTCDLTYEYVKINADYHT